MDNQSYVIDGDLTFGDTYTAMKFYQQKYHEQANRIEKLNEECNNLARTVDSMAEELIKNKGQADRIAELESCLDFALQDTMDYIRLNNLGGENNHWLVWARKLLVNTTPQTKPLSDDEIDDFTVKVYNCRTGAEANEIVKAIEAKVRGTT
jgi:hypothetical protein